MADFEDELRTLPPRPPLTRGVPSAAEREWFQKHFLSLLPKDGPDLMRRFRVGRSQPAKVPNG